MITLREFMGIDVIHDSVILSGSDKLDEVDIRYISVIELPVDDFIRENELVLSTAIGCYHSDAKMLSFVEEVFHSSAAALVLSLKDDSYQLPQSVIDFAKGKDFPLIRIPWECRFSEIIETVLDKIRNDDISRSYFFSQVQKQLLSVYLDSNDLSVASQLIAKNLKCPIVITDETKAIRGASGLTSRATHFDPTEGTAYVSVPLETNGHLFGYLHVDKRNCKNSDLCDKNFLKKYIALPLTLWFDKEDSIANATQHAKDDFIWNLANGRFENEASMMDAGNRLNFNLSVPYSCVLGKVSALHDDTALLSEIGASLQQIKLRVIDLGKISHNKLLVTAQANLLLFYFENQSQDPEKRLHQFLDYLEEHLHLAFPKYTYTWGISKISLEKTDFAEQYNNARLALNICDINLSDRNRSTYEDTSIFRFLSILSANSRVMQLASETLKALSDYDDLKHQQLIPTLACYIQNNYNISRTARSLHLHRQSLLYRLAKIESLANISFDNHNDLFLLEICTRLFLNYRSVSNDSPPKDHSEVF